MKKTKLFALILAFAMVFSFVSCGKDAPDEPVEEVKKDIYVLYTSDVHCGIDENIGYAGLAAYRASLLEKTDHVALVDCGDAIQGEVIGTVSKGEYIVDIMNYVDYDFAVLGNHEFDYGMEQISTLISKSDATYLGCNLTYSGEGESALSAVKPYEIVTYGEKKVAFIGVSTPNTIKSSTPSYFMDENGQFVYGFTGENNGAALYECVQQYVDECRNQGANYVIVLAHLGDQEGEYPYTSVNLINDTTGIDVVIDGHSHSTIPYGVEENKNGEEVVLTACGTKLENIGQLLITEEGGIVTTLISRYDIKDSAVESFVNDIKASYDEAVNKVVATSDIALSIKDENGIRMVRSRETAIGNLCADAYRTIAGTNIAIVNGGGIRADLPTGNITYSDVVAVHPYGNKLTAVKATGQEILDALELSAKSVEAEYADNGNALGEYGGFLSVSGLKFTVDTSVPSAVTLDENGMFVSVDGDRRVKDVMILGENGEYTPIDPAAEYTVASHNYLIKESGDGYTMFKDNELIINEAMQDYEVLITYITEHLAGSLSEKYSSIEGRITIG